MGGHISVGVRRADGSFRTIGVWTNPLYDFMREKTFRIDGSLEPLDRFFARYLKEDVDFGGPQDTVPGEYGFVLVDEQTKTITTMNSYSSLQWVHESELGYVSAGRMFASQEAFAEMAELREGAVRARYVIPGTGEWTVEDLPVFTTHEGMFSLMEELTRRGQSVTDEEATLKLVELQAALDDLDVGARTSTTDEELARHLLNAQFVISGIKRRLGSRLTVQYGIAFPAWTIVDLWPENEVEFLRMQAAVEDIAALTEEERTAWTEEFEWRFREGEADPDDGPDENGGAALSARNLAILMEDEEETR